jgi:nucleolar protein 56
MLYVLFEHACGYALFSVREFEEIGSLEREVASSVADPSRFSSVVKLVSWSPFKNAANALDNMLSISEGLMHDDLRALLETSLPARSKSQKSKKDAEEVLLGVGESKLAASIAEELNVSCTQSGIVPEIMRGLRLHAEKLIKGLAAGGSALPPAELAANAQRALAHAYSRSKVKFNVNRIDNMIIQAIALLDQLDKDVNTFTMRVREWYSYHFPELARLVADQQLYCRVVHLIGDRRTLTTEKLTVLSEYLTDETLAKHVYDAAKSSMGMDISPLDVINIGMLTRRVLSLLEYRRALHDYLLSKMEQVAPNLAALVGELVGARLISHAGSLTSLAKYPASTVQILGAEKALFRALKSRGKCKTPKYGLIFHSSFIARAAARNKGRISRFLANKCSLASRIDCFSVTESNLQISNAFGRLLREQVEERLKFIESPRALVPGGGGKAGMPRKNIDVMKAALVLSLQETKLFLSKARMSFDKDQQAQAAAAGNGVSEAPRKKKHKRGKSDEGAIAAEVVDEEISPLSVSLASGAGISKKHKKKHAQLQGGVIIEELPPDADAAADQLGSAPVSKHKKNKHQQQTDATLMDFA